FSVILGLTACGAWERFLNELSVYSRLPGCALPCIPHGAAYIGVVKNNERTVILTFNVPPVARIGRKCRTMTLPNFRTFISLLFCVIFRPRLQRRFRNQRNCRSNLA